VAWWPTVREGGGSRPEPVAEEVEEGLALARPREVVAWGEVDAVPWCIHAFETAPGPRGTWWEHGPVGPQLELLLGRDGRLGGGGVHARLNEGTHVTASISFFGRLPQIVVWLGVVSEDVSRLEARLDDGDVRVVEPRAGPFGFPRLFWFFPPRSAAGELVALGPDGEPLERHPLVDADVHPNANTGTSVNPLGYPVGTPPPGWPPDRREYRPGEGPRHGDDFHLHESSFPLYAVPPARWEGYVSEAGSGRSGGQLDRVAFGYFDEPGGEERGFEVTNERVGRDRFDRPPGPEDMGIWWSDPFTGAVVVNFACRFLSHEGRRAFAGPRGRFEAGPHRVVELTPLDVAGHRVHAAFREYRRLPSLRSITLDLPDVHIVVIGWAMSFGELRSASTALERLRLGSELFHALASAQRRSDARFAERLPHR
jgi:hypothetical protein